MLLPVVTAHRMYRAPNRTGAARWSAVEKAIEGIDFGGAVPKREAVMKNVSLEVLKWQKRVATLADPQASADARRAAQSEASDEDYERLVEDCYHSGEQNDLAAKEKEEKLLKDEQYKARLDVVSEQLRGTGTEGFTKGGAKEKRKRADALPEAAPKAIEIGTGTKTALKDLSDVVKTSMDREAAESNERAQREERRLRADERRMQLEEDRADRESRRLDLEEKKMALDARRLEIEGAKWDALLASMKKT